MKKGNVSTFDTFFNCDSRENYNTFVSASSGGGMSFLVVDKGETSEKMAMRSRIQGRLNELFCEKKSSSEYLQAVLAGAD